MVSNNFINECKNRANKNRLGQIIVDGIETSITQSNNLQSFVIDSGCYIDGNIIGSVYAKCLKANFIADENNLTDKSIQAQIGVKYADLSVEYINMGKYIVERPNNEITANMSQITAYSDLYTNLDNKYVCNIDYSSGGITLSDLYIDVCNQLGLIPITTTFTNSTIPITDNPFTNGEKNRTVLQTVAKISCSFIDIDNDTNKIDLCWLSQNEEPDYTFQINDYVNVEGGQVICGPINCLIIKNSQIDDENVTIRDDESISLYGEHSLVISEDYVLYNAELREQAIESIWNKVKGMKYVDCKLTTYYGKPFLKLGDKIRIYISETEYFETYVLKHNFTYDGAFTSVIESPALTEQEIKTKQDVSLGEALKNTQIEVNKQKGEIKTVTQKTTEITNSLKDNYYSKTNVNELIQTSETGITNTFSEAGGNNIFRNTGLWFTTTAQNANFENRIKLRTDFELYSKEEASQFINEIGRIGSYEYTYEGSDYTIGTKTFISSVIPLSSTQNIYLFSPTNWLTYKNRDLTYDGIDYNFFSSEPPGMYHTPPYELYGIDENNKIIMKIQPFYANFEGGYSQLSFKNISLDSAYQNFSEELEKAVKGIIIVFKVTLSTYKFNPDDVNNPIKNDINIENYIKKYFLDYYNDPNNEENKNYIQQHINDYIPDQTSDFIKNETKKVDIIYQSIKTVSYGNFEYWEGNASRNSNENASNGNSMLLQNGEFSQEQMVNNGRYCISFKYQKLNPLAQASVIINDIEYPLDSEILTEFYTGKVDNETKVFLTQPLVVNAGYIRITFKCDINNAVEVYDLMCNKGISKSVYSQNENETTTDTVNISKGITITSTNMETIFKANADGVRLYTLSGQIKTRFTDKGMTTKEAIVEDEAQIVGTLWQEVEDQTWLTRM